MLAFAPSAGCGRIVAAIVFPPHLEEAARDACDARRATLTTPGEAAQLARWVYLSSAFGHYSGSLETVLASDVRLVRNPFFRQERPSLMQELIREAQEPRRPGTQLTGEDIRGKKGRSPLLRLLQFRATQAGAQSWLSNRAITYDPQHNGLAVEVHHIFPRAWLKKNDLGDHPEGDAMANFAFVEVGQHQDRGGRPRQVPGQG